MSNIVVQKIAGGWVGALMGPAIDGWGQLPSAINTAANQLARSQDHERAIKMLVTTHVSMSGAGGFVSNLGGLITMPITMPANLTGITIINLRLAAAIAHLRGYDVSDSRVRTACAMCLLGKDDLADPQLPSILTVATAPVVDRSLLAGVQANVSALLLTRIGGKQLVGGLLKRIPVAGGAIGAGTDGWTTYEAASLARASFSSRRRVS